MKQVLAFLHGRFADALAAAREAEPMLGAARATPIEATHHFFHALTLTALFPDAPATEQAQFARLLENELKKLKLWADNCPQNYHNRYTLVLAELARIEGRPAEAMDLYEMAIRSARDNGFVQNEALAFEQAARFYATRGFVTFAHAYLRNARDGYARWGADGKVRKFDIQARRLRRHLKTHDYVAARSASPRLEAAWRESRASVACSSSPPAITRSFRSGMPRTSVFSSRIGAERS